MLTGYCWGLTFVTLTSGKYGLIDVCDMLVFGVALMRCLQEILNHMRVVCTHYKSDHAWLALQTIDRYNWLVQVSTSKDERKALLIACWWGIYFKMVCSGWIILKSSFCNKQVQNECLYVYIVQHGDPLNYLAVFVLEIY